MNRSMRYTALVLLGLSACSQGAGIEAGGSAVESDAFATRSDVVTPAPDALADSATKPPLSDTLEPTGDTTDEGSGGDAGAPPEASDAEDSPCPGCVGAPCEDAEDCFSGWCVEGPEGSICTKTCEGDCPEGFSCKEVASSSGDPVFICVYAHLPYCRPCTSDADCAHPLTTGINSRCISHGEALGSYCSTACTAGAGCPSGASCEDVGTDEEYCLPSEGAECTCSSWAIEVAAQTSCLVENEIGSCPGTRSCEAEGLSACSGELATLESCNGADDDCDGEVDEDFPLLGEACDGDDEDLCEGGIWSCSESGEVSCTDDAAPNTELCNTLDDDCDGEVDEDFPSLGAPCDGADVDLCEDGVWTCDGLSATCEEPGDITELCNGVDDDCDEGVDEDFPDLGEACDGDDPDDCMFGTWSCVADGIACEEPALPELSITDLDGTPNLALGDPCGVGACEGGVVTCGDELTSLACSTSKEVTEETCNGLDDDCDGVTDEDFAPGGSVSFTDLNGTSGLALGENCGDGACQGGIVTCDEAGTGLVCSSAQAASTDLCNGVDDDCDGAVDEDYGIGGSVTLSDPSSPEPLTLGQACGVGLCAGGNVVCTPEGTGLSCSSAGSAGEDVCDGLDNDCDGVTDEAYIAGGSFSLTDLNGTEGLTKGDPCGAGACEGGIVACSADMGALVCSTHDVVDVDICDSVDNDCDGVTDEDYIEAGSVSYDDPGGESGLIKGDPCGAGVCDGGSVVCGADKLSLTCSNSPEGGELCDDIDNDCDGEVDEGCDDDGDGYCDANLELVGAPESCPLGGGDCDDDAELIHPGINESCDDIDNNCTAGVDEGCDDDGDDFCDAEMNVVGTPAVCPAGVNDCNDDEPAINGAAVELCDDIDNDCNGNLDEGCNDDSDDYCDATMITVGTPAVCQAGGGDCDDTRDDVYPGALELCDDIDNNCIEGVDEDCDGDGDGYCDLAATVIGAPAVCSAGTGDCNDANAAINPGAVELCDDVDNDCKDGIDFGCDDDGDGYCDAEMSVVALPESCPMGGGDCDDTSGAINPGATELCDDVDNDCAGGVDEGCDDDDDDYCDANMEVIGAPSVCPLGGADCADESPLVHPGASEVCDDLDNNCTGGLDEGCDDDGDGFCDAAMVTLGLPATCLNGGGDCDDSAGLIYPGATELCDDLDNNCTGGLDEGCDDDDDDFCDAAMEVIGMPETCALGGGDCADTNDAIHPNAAEVCDDLDNNCTGGLDEGCDDDGDDYCDATMAIIGSPAACPEGGGDCDDTQGAVNPGEAEVCDDLDNNCTSGIDEGCDDDGDDFCDATMEVVGLPGVCPQGAGDCADTEAEINPSEIDLCDAIDNDCDGETDGPYLDGSVTYDDDPSGPALTKGDACGAGACAGGAVICGPDELSLVCSTDNAAGSGELCDGVDNDCNGEVDEGCDDDNDGYCDVTMTVIGVPSVCPNGLGDCNDEQPGINPGVTEICDDIDNDCAFGVDQGCDDDGDGYCDEDMIVLGSPSICTLGGGDCVDTSESIHPNATEICDGIDNDCAQGPDEGCDDDGDGFCDITMLTVGTPWSCTSGGGDCNDGNPAVNPAALELCDNIDNDCNEGPDEGCDDDNDNYCDATMSVIGTPSTCSLGGGDCDDSSGAINPGASEVCDNADNDCNDQADEGCDDDNDNYCDAAMSVIGTPSTCTSGGGDCNDSDEDINPGKAELCNGVDDNCAGGIDEGLSAPLNPNQNGACEGSTQSCTGAGGWIDDYSGVLTYGLSETPNSAFFDENCDGLDGDKDNAVFVSTNGINNNICSQKAPCSTIAHGISRALAQGKAHVYIRAGTYSGPITLEDGVSLFGGYDSGWVRDAHTVPGHLVTINGGYHAATQQYLVLQATSVDSTIADLKLNAPNANGRTSSGQGRSSYALHSRSSELALRRMTIDQGNGYSGQGGTSGSSASQSSAPGGGDGGKASQFVSACNTTSHGDGGGGGSYTCSGTSTKGGSGGNGGEMDTSCGWTGFCSNCNATSGDSGASGSGPSASGGGGAGGGGGTCSQGGDASNGSKTNGGGGSGATTKGRLLSSYYWHGKDGGNGSLGSHGRGGGGGGGSGGCDAGALEADSYGAGGGGGGAGGCRAPSAGSAGKGGGGSFGVFGYSSDLTINQVSFVRGNGGDGGNGGGGGLGQPGGSGGDAGEAAGNAKRGGYGGDGGRGGHSGGGGGGGGGHSYGIYTYASSVTQSSNSFSSGSAGDGGSGGSSSGSSGSSGAAGFLGSIGTCSSPNGC